MPRNRLLKKVLVVLAIAVTAALAAALIFEPQTARLMSLSLEHR